MAAEEHHVTSETFLCQEYVRWDQDRGRRGNAPLPGPGAASGHFASEAMRRMACQFLSSIASLTPPSIPAHPQRALWVVGFQNPRFFASRHLSSLCGITQIETVSQPSLPVHRAGKAARACAVSWEENQGSGMNDKAPGTAVAPATGLDSLKDLTLAIQHSAGFHPVIAALRNGGGVSVDGAWNSSAALLAAALALHAPHALGGPGPSAQHRRLERRPAQFRRSAARPVPGLGHLAGARRLSMKSPASGCASSTTSITNRRACCSPPCRRFSNRCPTVPNSRPSAAPAHRPEHSTGTNSPPGSSSTASSGWRRWSCPANFRRAAASSTCFPTTPRPLVEFELFGDEIESIRQFSPQTQRSLGELPAVEITAGHDSAKPATPTPADHGHLADYLPPNTWTLLVEPEELHEQGKHFLERISDLQGLFSLPAVFAQLQRFAHARLTALPSPGAEVACHLRVESVERFSGDVAKVRDELDGIAVNDRVLIACHNDAERSAWAKCSRLATWPRLIGCGWWWAASTPASAWWTRVCWC